MRASDVKDPVSGHNVYYHANFHLNSDPATIQTLIRYQGQKSPMKQSRSPGSITIRIPKSAAAVSRSGGAAAARKATPSSTAVAASTDKSPSKARSRTTTADAASAAAAENIVELGKNQPTLLKQSKKKRRSNTRVRQPVAKRVKVSAPKNKAEKSNEKAKVPPPLVTASSNARASTIAQFSRFHRMRKIESQFSEGLMPPGATLSMTQTETTTQRIVSGKVRHASEQPMSESVPSHHAVALQPPPFAFSVTGSVTETPVVSTGKNNRDSVLFLPDSTPVKSNKSRSRSDNVFSSPHALSSPAHLAMLSAFLETPSPNKRSKNVSTTTPIKDGFRVLFHAAQAVEHSPMLLAKAQSMASPSGNNNSNVGEILSNSAVKSSSSPIGSMLNMDLDSFGHAMDALEA
ncbi:MAG: hypothetical protein SGILL_008358 [Bacillariaceae sp.]